MKKPIVIALAGLAVLLQWDPKAAWSQRVPPACPSHLRLIKPTGDVLDFLGSVPGVPDLCHTSRTGEGEGDYYFGAWRTDWPGAGQAYPALWAVVHGGKGARASFITRSYPGLQWLDSFENLGVEDVLVDGKARSALRLAHERAGIEGNTYHSIITQWKDLATGAIIRVLEQQISGKSYGPGASWQAVRLELLETPHR